MEGPPRLVAVAIQSGVWHGRVLGAPGGPAPRLSAWHQDTELAGPDIVPARSGPPGVWEVRLAIPADLLSDGVQTVVIADAETGAALESFTLVAGDPLAGDLRAEIDLLRAEVDMLKRALRRILAD